MLTPPARSPLDLPSISPPQIPKEERILVFVQFVDLLDKTYEALKAEGVAAARLTGTPNQRSTIIEAFQQPSTPADTHAHAHGHAFRSHAHLSDPTRPCLPLPCSSV